jgi:hypothetical protein
MRRRGSWFKQCIVVEASTYITRTEMNILLKTFLITNEFYKKWKMRALTRHVGKECAEGRVRARDSYVTQICTAFEALQ